MSPATDATPVAVPAKLSQEELLNIFPQHHILLNLPVGLTITVVGGGHGAHTAAAYLGSKPGLAVNVLTRQPEKWKQYITIGTANTAWSAKGEILGLLNKVTSDASEVIPHSDIVLILLPAHTHPCVLAQVTPHLKKGAILGSLYCQGGFDWPAQKYLKENNKLDVIDGYFGLLNIPWITNAAIYGERVRLIGPKKVLRLAANPRQNAQHYASLVSSLFDIPTVTVPNFLSLCLTPSNQIIHPARYYGIFKDWDGKKTYAKDEVQWGLYSELDALSAEKLENLDRELQMIKKSILEKYPSLDLSSVMPIGERIIHQYGDDVKDRSSLQQIFNTNLGYAGCITPTLEVERGRFIPKVDSRLFNEDIPFGLCILKSLAQMCQIQTPEIDFMIRWHQQFMGKEFLSSDGYLNKDLINETGCPEAYGITTLQGVVESSL